ncbi:MAG TPA: response regulator [Planctomycetota bacterium]|jgi:DNA-binding response OmpR family regulator|nr:response regulator [Planctomycetota bacterium]
MPKKKPAVRKRVLIIEDDEDVAEILEVLVRGLHADVLVADDGMTGVELARTERPDLVLVDIHLPGISGLEVIRALRATAKLEALPIIVITGNSTVEYVRETAKLGANDFLVKANVLAGDGLDRIERFLSLPGPSSGKRTRKS